jgi:DUF1680 family protein
MNILPSVLETEIEGVSLKIEVETEYPFTDSVRLAISASQPKLIPIAIRIPLDGALVVADVQRM